MKRPSILPWIKSHKKRTVIIIISLLILGLIFRPKASKPITTETVTRSDIVKSISASGTVYSNSSVNLNFLAGGKLVYLGAKKGDRVQIGQVIATIDQRSAQASLKNALIDYDKQRNTFDTTQENNGNRKPQDALNEAMKRVLENNQYDLNKAITSVELQSLAKEQSVLTTPIAGVVTKEDVTTAGVNIGPTTTFSISDTANLVFRADVDEADIGQIQANQEMKITLDAYPDQPITIAIESIDYTSHQTSTGGTAFTVEGILPPNSNEYRIGMNGDAEIIVARIQKVPTISLSSLIDDTHIYVQNGKTFEKRTVKLGIQSDTEAEVINGVKVGDKVALTPDDVEKQFPKLKSE
jgi:HlyD family secretion protein